MISDRGDFLSAGELAAAERYLAEALELAACVPERTWPNPPVGAVVVRDGKIVGRGAHRGAGSPHAEQVALADAGPRAQGATLYCTLEPCNHAGHTPPCAPAVAASGVRRVVIGVADPNPRVAGGGIGVLREAGLEVHLGVLARQTLELIWPFVATDAFARPYVELKTASSLDDRFAPPRPKDAAAGPIYLTGEAARHDVHVRRRWVDLVLVGKRTAQLDRPQLDGRLAGDSDRCPGAEPAAGYVDTGLSYTGGLARPGYLVFTGQREPAATERIEASGGRVIVCDERNGRVDPRSLLAQAHELQIHTIMVEGGPCLAASFLAAGCVDRWVRYVAPSVCGGGASWPDSFGPIADTADRFHATGAELIGDDLRLIHDRRDFVSTLERIAGDRTDTGRC